MIILIFLFHLITKMNDDEIYNFGMILMNFHLHKEIGPLPFFLKHGILFLFFPFLTEIYKGTRNISP